ncbi:MAG TPA: bifunctional UDP-N-acetylglucosamine diphosphorylase/glucosamine-1-phosphate N-acetyltransferase GlmU [Actinomycetota bacterium]
MAQTKQRRASVAAVILAAGKGKRLGSATPKVLHPIVGRPALWHVLRAAMAAEPERIAIVIGHGGERVREAVDTWGIRPRPVFVEQGEQLGTGHATLAAERAVGRAAEVLVLAGDDPLVEGRHVRQVLALHHRTKAAASFLTTLVDEPGGYARVVREGSRLVALVEESDVSADHAAIREIGVVVYAFRRRDLFRALPAVGRDNRQREHYLNDVIPILLEEGERVSAAAADFGGWAGVNSRETIVRCERIMRARINGRLMDAGVTIVDPGTTYVDVGVTVGRDTRLLPMTFLEGDTRVGRGATIGPNTRLVDTKVGDRSEVSFSVADGAAIGRDVTVGPFARLRRGAVLEDGSTVGDFVEVNRARVGRGSVAKHLTYIGDAEIGEGVNIGAGTVFVNYDGYRKHTTVVEDGARIGSDTMLVAPLRIGRGASTGAGSVITEDVPAGALAVERSEQRTVEGYRKRKDAEHRREGKG